MFAFNISISLQDALEDWCGLTKEVYVNVYNNHPILSKLDNVGSFTVSLSLVGMNNREDKLGLARKFSKKKSIYSSLPYSLLQYLEVCIPPQLEFF